MRSIFIMLVISLFTVCGFASDRALVMKQMKSEQRLALLIGNSKYKSDPLRNPVNDVRAMGAKLTSLGFEVIKVEDADQRAMDESISKFGKKLRSGGVGLFYYAGHGMQVSGDNYLVPVNSGIEIEGDVKYRAVNVGSVLSRMESAGNRLNIVLLDACRNNPFARSWRSADKGLAKVDAPTGTFIAYATAPGSVASDGAGDNGLFSEALLKSMDEEGLSIESLMKRVRIHVANATDKKQIPWTSSSLMGDFYFRLPGVKAEPKTVVTEQKVAYVEPKPAVVKAPVKEIARFLRSSDGVVTDSETGVMWQDTLIVQKKWGDAEKHCQNLNLAGNSDWRLPTVAEINSILDNKKVGMNKFNHSFRDTGLIPFSWSSKSVGNNVAFALNSMVGKTMPVSKNASFITRCVRKEK